ncbi:MAG: hypothetical protein H0T62_13010 [Parachlamydiaceae bacterium]|nr:hypothetical protein [Parachlamydiaceae bacterium]
MEGEGVINYRRRLDANNNKAAVWQTFAPGGSSVLCSTCMAKEEEWCPYTVLSMSEKASEPLVAVVANNQDISVVATWKEVNAGITSLYGAMRVNQTTGWSSPIRISLELEDVQNQISLQISSKGTIMAAWSSLNSKNQESGRQASAQMGPSNTWNLPVSLPPDNS